jgi:hypothetical protein
MILQALERAQKVELEEVAEFIANLALSKCDAGKEARKLTWFLTSENAITKRYAKYLWVEKNGEVSGTLLTEAQVIERAGKDHGFKLLPWSKTIL